MITCMVYVFAALLEFAIVYHVHYRRSQAELLSPTPQSNGPVTQVTQVSSGHALLVAKGYVGAGQTKESVSDQGLWVC